MIGQITYGSILLQMTYCDLDRRPLMSSDNTTYECTEYNFDVMCIYNPKATSYSGRDHTTPRASVVAFGGETDLTIREYLAQPRRLLTIQYGDNTGRNQTYLESPPKPQDKPRYPSDVRNGPFCEVMSIKEHHGTKTWIMHLRFRTYINEQFGYTSPILSHRFKKTVDVDEDYYTTLITQGEVVFHVGRLHANEQSPDFWRSQFFGEPLGNFKRVKISVDVSEDNSRAHYTVVDRSQAFNLGTNSPATRVEAFITTGYSQGSLTNTLANYAESALQISSSALMSMTIDAAHNTFVGLAAVPQTALAVARAYNANVPRYYVSAKCRAWGSEISQRRDLLDLCFGIITARLGRPDFWDKSNTTEINISQEITGKYVEVDMMLRWTDEMMASLTRAVVTDRENFNAQTIARLESNGASFYSAYFPVDENITIQQGPMNGIANGQFTQRPVGNRPPGYTARDARRAFGHPDLTNPDLYVRGAKMIEKLIVGALSAPGENPPIQGMRDPTVNG